MIYFIRQGSGNVKVGYTGGRVEERLAQLQTGSGERLTLLGSFPGGRLEELKLHLAFKDLHVIGEWYRYEGVLREFVNKLSDLTSKEQFLTLTLDTSHDDEMDAAILMLRLKRGK